MSVSFIPTELSSEEIAMIEADVLRRMERHPDPGAIGPVEIERQSSDYSQMVGRAYFAAAVKLKDELASSIQVNGERYRYKGVSSVDITTMMGDVRVDRRVFVRRGGHGGATVAPLDEWLGLTCRMTPLATEVTASFMAALCASKSQQLMGLYGGMTPSTSTLGRAPKKLLAVWEANRTEIDAEVREITADQLPPEWAVATIAFSLDGVMLSMKSAPRSKEPTGPNGYKEASTATATLYDSEGHRLFTIYLGRMPEKNKVSLQRLLSEEIGFLIARFPKAQLVAVADGATENWRIFNEIATEHSVKVTHVLDFYHLMEKVGDAVSAHYGGKKKEAEDELKTWAERLKSQSHAPEQLLRRLYELRRVGGTVDTLEKVNAAITYVDNNRNRIAYRRFLEHGLPIGSGVQEAACKILVSERMKLSGMTWEHEGGQAILNLRAAAYSGRLSAVIHAILKRARKAIRVDLNTARQRPQRVA